MQHNTINFHRILLIFAELLQLARVDSTWILVDIFIYVNAYDESETKKTDFGTCL